MKYALNDNEVVSSLLINNKDNIIKRFTVISDEEKSEIIDFFKSHSNLENKVDWNKMANAQESLYQDIQNLMAETKKRADEKRQRKTDIKSLFKDKENFEILGEDDRFVYVAPLTWEACVFIDSFKCGGQGATWCIGWERSDNYWRQYTEDGYVFVLMMSKHGADGYVLERLHQSGDIYDDKIYDLSDYDYEGGDYPNLKYPKDNKVMLQIDPAGYVTAWEQTDDFPLFENKSIGRIIKDCELGFEWDDMEYERISDLIGTNNHRLLDDIVVFNGDSVTLDLDTWLFTEGVSANDVNEYLEEKYNEHYISVVGDCNNALGDMLYYVFADSLDLSKLNVSGSVWNLRTLIGDMYDIRDTLDVSCFSDNSVITDDFLNCLSGDPEVIVVNPNCDVLIDYINEYNQKNGTDIQIKMKYDYSNQPELDFGD